MKHKLFLLIHLVSISQLISLVNVLLMKQKVQFLMLIWFFLLLMVLQLLDVVISGLLKMF